MDKRLYLRHFATLFSGTAIAQTINFASYPVLTRSYSAEHFGEFAIFVATTAFFGVISCGRFDAAIHAARPYARFAVFALALRLNLVTSVTLVLILGLLGWVVETGFEFSQLLLLGLAVFLTGYCNAASFFVLKQEIYRSSSISNVIRTACTALPQIALYYFFPDSWGLVLGFCLGFALQGMFLYRVIRTRLVSRRASSKQIACVYARHRQYLMLDVPSQILSVSALYATNYFILYLYSSSEVGYYSLAFRLAAVPLTLFASALSQVFFQKAAASWHERGVFWDEFKFSLCSSSILSATIFLLILIGARPVVAFYLGTGWVLAGDFIVCLAPMLALRFVSASIAAMPLVVGRPHILLVNNFAVLVSICLAFVLAWARALEITDYLILSSALSSAVHLVFIVYLVIETHRRYS